jgi:hypothetical protein
MTWSDQRRQWGRLLRRGLTQEQARALAPRCQKCLTTALIQAGLSDPRRRAYRPRRLTEG